MIFKKKNPLLIIFLFLLVSVLFSHLILAAEQTTENDLKVLSGIELDNVITLLSSILAVILFSLTLLAYKRTGRNKLIYIALAFLLFAIKGFLISSDIFFLNKGAWVDPVANFLDFAILISFFCGMIKK
jgi:hypothetical protein